MADRIECRWCGTEQVLKQDGTFRKHDRDGDTCPGSGQPPNDETPQAPEQETPETPQQDEGGFTWSLTVSQCPYLDDKAWHLANLRMASRKAEEAGHTTTGEGSYDGLTDNGDGTLTLTYRVPVAD